MSDTLSHITGRKPITKPAATPPALVLGRTAMVVVTLCTMLATLMQALDSTIANVALPYMQGAMSASQDEINWVLTSYIVACAIMTAPVGFLANRFGRTRLFVVSIIGFTLASILCGAAQSLGQIVLFRLLQGACGAALVPLSQAVLMEIFPLEKRGAAMALWGVGVQIGPILGPILGGWLTQDLSWRWVFYVNVPFGIIATTGLLMFLKEGQVNRSARMDWLGFLALSLAIGAFQLMLDRGAELDWFASPEIITEACLAALGLYIFIIQTVLAAKPFLSPRLFLDANFLVGIIVIFMVGLNLFATLALLAPYLQVMAGEPVITAGLLLAPRGIGTMAAMLIAGRMLGRVDVRIFLISGFVIGAYALAQFMTWTPDVSQTSIIITGVIQGISVGLIFVPMATVVFGTLPPELRVEATGVFSLMRNLGSAIGISITAALLETNTHINHAIIAQVITPFNHALQQGVLGHYWNPGTAGGAAALDAQITRQAVIIAYADDFKLMLVATLVVMPLLLLLRPIRPAARPGT